eukprot:ANDGO_06249.mRNA.1 E3 ubiquitin-protein ligase RKP
MSASPPTASQPFEFLESLPTFVRLELISDVFGVSVPVDANTHKQDGGENVIYLSSLEKIVQDHLDMLDQSLRYSQDLPDVNGRIGPDVTQIDQDRSWGEFDISNNAFIAKSAFVSLRSSTCLYSGKWMYEVQLETDGVMQLGFVSRDSPFNETSGVGDFADSFAYDGRRLKKWNVQDETYGEFWTAGDSIGVGLDLNEGRIEYFRNGVFLGAAFSSVKKGAPGDIAYFPSVSISRGQSCSLNFGQEPFRYPIDGFAPVDTIPNRYKEKAKFLMSAIEACCMKMSKQDALESRLSSSETNYVKLLPVLDVSFRFFAPYMMDDWVIQALWLPFLIRLRSATRGSLFPFFGILRCCVPSEALKDCIQFSMRFCGRMLTGPSFDDYFTIAIEIISFRPFLLLWASSFSFRADLERFFFVRSFSHHDLHRLIPDSAFIGSRTSFAFRDAEDLLKSSLSARHIVLEENRLRLVSIFIDDLVPFSTDERRILQSPFFSDALDSESKANCLTGLPSTPSHLLLFWLQNHVLARNAAFCREIRPPTLSHQSILISLLLTLLRKCESSFSSLIAKFGVGFPVLLCFFGRPSLALGLDCIGGTMSHIMKNVPSAVSELCIAAASATSDVAAELSYAFLHSSVVLFHYVGRSHFSGILETQREYTRLSRSARLSDEITARQLYRAMFVERCQQRGFEKNKLLIGFCAYIANLLRIWSPLPSGFLGVPVCYVTTLVDLFQYLRQAELQYFSATSDCPQILMLIVKLMSDFRILVDSVRESLASVVSSAILYEHFVHIFTDPSTSNSRVLMQSLIDIFLGRSWVATLSVIVRLWRGKYFASFVTDDEVSGLILIGDTVPECDPLQKLRDSFSALLSDDSRTTTNLLNRILNQLNWSLTEMSVAVDDMSKELSEMQVRPSAVFTRDLQDAFSRNVKKCTIMFDVSWMLLRFLEIVSIEAPRALLGAEEDPVSGKEEVSNSNFAAEIALSRSVEALLFVLSHFSVGSTSRSFDTVLNAHTAMVDDAEKEADILRPAGADPIAAAVDRAVDPYLVLLKHLPLEGLAKIRRSFLLAPVIGILSRLHLNDRLISGSVSNLVSKSLVDAGVFTCLTPLTFLGKLKWDVCKVTSGSSLAGAVPAEEEPTFSMPSLVNEYNILVEECQRAFASSNESVCSVSSTSADVCVICYKSVVSCRFVPCGHTSCRRCIRRHLLNSDRCFFCNSQILSVEDTATRPASTKTE